MNYAPYLGAIRGEHVRIATRSIGAALIEQTLLEEYRCSREGNSEMGWGVRIFDSGRMKQGRSESSRLAQRHPKVFMRYIDFGHGGCDSLARFSGKKFVPRAQYATHFSARRSVEHVLLVTY